MASTLQRNNHVRTSIAIVCLLLVDAVRAGERPEWLQVPFVSQSRDGCGAAAIAMVMQYWMKTNPELDPATADDALIYRQLAVPGRRGLAGLKLQQYLEENGFAAHVFRGEPHDLRHHIEQGRPLVACLAPRGRSALLHFVVVVGASESRVLFHDPARGKLIEQGLAAFTRQWTPTGNWTLLASPQKQ